MGKVLVFSLRRALAAVVLGGGVTLAALIATPRSETRLAPTLAGTGQPVVLSTPSWAIPVGVCLGLLAIALAILLYRPWRAAR